MSFVNSVQKSLVRLIASKRKIKKLFFDKLEIELLSFKEQGYFKETGWIKSFENQNCIDAEGNPLPWVTYSFIDFIKERLSKNISLFEYGSGYSTLFYAERVKEVDSVEHDKNWYEKVKVIMPANVKLIYQELEYNGNYCKSVELQNKKYGIIIVDGRDRVQCCYSAVNALSQDGVLVLDDSERQDYLDAIGFLGKKGFKKIDFWGVSPGFFYRKCTTVFYRSENILVI